MFWVQPMTFRCGNGRLNSQPKLYYKQLDNLIPYVVDDVDIQYLPQYTAKGFATGIEFKLNGEFVKNAESWATLSFLKPVKTGIMMHMDPIQGPPISWLILACSFRIIFPVILPIRYIQQFILAVNCLTARRIMINLKSIITWQAYKRIDIGLSKSLITDKNGNRKIGANFIRDAWISLEVFNLFGFNNMASYQWIRTVSNQEGLPNMFAVPNYLTGRLFNVKLTVQF